MPRSNEIDPMESPLDPDATQAQLPLSGTVDDDDNMDDERWDENEAPTRKLSDRGETSDESARNEQENDGDADLTAEDNEGLDSQ